MNNQFMHQSLLINELRAFLLDSYLILLGLTQLNHKIDNYQYCCDYSDNKYFNLNLNKVQVGKNHFENLLVNHKRYKMCNEKFCSNLYKFDKVMSKIDMNWNKCLNSSQNYNLCNLIDWKSPKKSFLDIVNILILFVTKHSPKYIFLYCYPNNNCQHTLNIRLVMNTKDNLLLSIRNIKMRNLIYIQDCNLSRYCPQYKLNSQVDKIYKYLMINKIHFCIYYNNLYCCKYYNLNHKRCNKVHYLKNSRIGMLK